MKLKLQGPVTSFTNTVQKAIVMTEQHLSSSGLKLEFTMHVDETPYVTVIAELGAIGSSVRFVENDLISDVDIAKQIISRLVLRLLLVGIE